MIDYVYRVRFGDTMESVASAFDISVLELEKTNNITRIREGDRLIIMKKPKLTHMVKPNETLEEIANRYHKNVDELRKLNDVDYIYTGLNLVIER